MGKELNKHFFEEQINLTNRTHEKMLRDTCTPMFIAALFIIARTWKQPRCPSADEWIRNCGTYTQWSITQPLKRIRLNQF